MLSAPQLQEISSSLNRMGPDRSRWVKIKMLDGSTINAASFSVVGGLLLAVLDPERARDEYALVNPSSVAAYLPGAPVKEPAEA